MRRDEGLMRIGPEKAGSGSFIVVTNPMVATEYAAVVGRQETGVVRLTVEELGFANGATRRDIYKAAAERGFCGLDGYVCVKMAQTLRPSDGIVHLVWSIDAHPGALCGHVVSWSGEDITYELDRAQAFERLPPERTLIFAVRRQRPAL